MATVESFASIQASADIEFADAPGSITNIEAIISDLRDEFGDQSVYRLTSPHDALAKLMVVFQKEIKANVVIIKTAGGEHRLVLPRETFNLGRIHCLSPQFEIKTLDDTVKLLEESSHVWKSALSAVGRRYECSKVPEPIPWTASVTGAAKRARTETV